MLRSELRRAGLLSGPPRFVGVEGHPEWNREALDELLCDCYSFVFVRRLDSMLAQLEIKENIDGLVFLSIRNFLYERRKRSDPIGFRVFEVLQASVRRGIAEGRLYLLSGDAAIRNNSRIGIRDRLERIDDDRQVALEATAGELMPELVTARGSRQRAELEERTVRALTGFGSTAFDGFEFAEVVAAFRRAARRQWSIYVESPAVTGDEAEPATRLGRPWFELRQEYESLTDCVSARLAAAELDARTSAYLSRLWEFMRVSCLGAEEIPSRRKLAQQLKIPKDRLKPLLEHLGRDVERCRSGQTAQSPVTKPREGENEGVHT